MLRWPQIKQSHKSKFLTKLLLYSSAFHAVLCFCLFFLYTSSDVHLLMDVHSTASDVIVKFVAFEQRDPKQPQLKTGTALTKIRRKVPEKKVVKSTAKKVIPKKTLENTVKPKPKPVEKKVVKQKPIAVEKPKTKAQKTAPSPAQAKEQVKYVTHKQLDAVMLELVLQESIAEVWAPPAGMDGDLVCQVTLTVGWDGKLLESNIDKSSGVLVYDIAVEQAVINLSPPRQVWGKTVRVAFKP